MKKKKIRPKQTPSKEEREKNKDLDYCEKIEIQDWVKDCKRREYKESPEYKLRLDLAEKFKNKS